MSGNVIYGTMQVKEIVHYAILGSAYSEGYKTDSLVRRLSCTNQLVKYHCMHRYRVIKTNTIPPILFTAFLDEVTCELCGVEAKAQAVILHVKAMAYGQR